MNRLFYLFALITLLSCKGKENNNQAGNKDSIQNTSVKTEYTCPMHPDIVSDKPGTCPKCGMDLEAKS
jgi:hypothetical protein